MASNTLRSGLRASPNQYARRYSLSAFTEWQKRNQRNQRNGYFKRFRGWVKGCFAKPTGAHDEEAISKWFVVLFFSLIPFYRYAFAEIHSEKRFLLLLPMGLFWLGTLLMCLVLNNVSAKYGEKGKPIVQYVVIVTWWITLIIIIIDLVCAVAVCLWKVVKHSRSNYLAWLRSSWGEHFWRKLIHRIFCVFIVAVYSIAPLGAFITSCIWGDFQGIAAMSFFGFLCFALFAASWIEYRKQFRRTSSHTSQRNDDHEMGGYYRTQSPTYASNPQSWESGNNRRSISSRDDRAQSPHPLTSPAEAHLGPNYWQASADPDMLPNHPNPHENASNSAYKGY